MKKISALSLLILLLSTLVPIALGWELERPSDVITIDERTESSNTDGKASVGLGVHIAKYYENDPYYPAFDNDYLKLYISATANTRKIISYGVYYDYFYWHDSLPNSVFLDDDDGVWLSMEGLTARFYGGPHSAEYTSVWVSSNGFISFDPNSAPTNPYYPYSIPNLAQPNTFVAPFWTDLKPNYAGSITYGKVYHKLDGIYKECFAISWNDVMDSQGFYQTFQVLVENAQLRDFKHRQSWIWFQYESITPHDQVTVGIEDQQGGRGTSYNYQSLSSGTTLLFAQTSNSAFVGSLKIKMSESDDSADTLIEDYPTTIRGYNVILTQNLPDEQEQYAFALEGPLTLLISAIDLAKPSIYLSGAGFILDMVFIIPEWARNLARQQALARLLETDSYHTYAKVQAVEDPDGLFFSEALDASFGMLGYWILTDPNNIDHTLTVSAELTYYEYDAYGELVATPTISTSLKLKLTRDASNSFDTAKTISSGSYSRIYLGGNDSEDFYKINVTAGYAISAYMYPPLNADFDLYLYRPDRSLAMSSEKRELGASESVSATATSSTAGYWFMKMAKFQNSQGYYNFSADVYPSGGGGCPYVSTWNGFAHIRDNNLLAASEGSPEADVTDYYILQDPLIPNDDGSYSLLLSEYENEHDFFDTAQLNAVDHEANVKVAVSPYGEILTYIDPYPAVSAIDDNHRNVKRILSLIDGKYYEGHNGSYITLNFGDLDVDQEAKLVLMVDGYKRSIYVQVQDSKGNWNTVATVIPRINWATEIIDMSNYLPDAKGNLKVRLYFTANHKLDFVGLDTSPQATIHVQNGQLVSAIHSIEGYVTAKLLYSDQTHVELMPGQEIKLTFTLPPQTMETRNYIIIVQGHYYTIKQDQ